MSHLPAVRGAAGQHVRGYDYGAFSWLGISAPNERGSLDLVVNLVDMIASG